MIIITSAAYVGYELAAEFGEIPPCMLPLGNRPSLELQVKAIKKNFPTENIVLSLPLSYIPHDGIIKYLNELKIKHIGVPDGLKLVESILFVINTMGDENSTIRLLHGDTLINDLPKENDALAVAQTQTDYNWEIEIQDNRKEIVWCGYFSFSDKRLFTKCLALSNGNFVNAVRKYDGVNKLKRYISKDWSDIGHVNTYFATRAKITTERDFNLLKIKDGIVRKSSKQKNKIKAEINWYLNIPPKIKIKTPQLIEYNDKIEEPYYLLEYLNLTPLNELYVHGENSIYFWDKIISHCDKFLIDCTDPIHELSEKKFDNNNENLSKNKKDLLVNKTWSRLKDFQEKRKINLDQKWIINNKQILSINEITSICLNKALSTNPVNGIMHGDLCFSNILYDSRADGIKIIDPRGLNNDGNFNIHGDITYDLAKLMHSVIGLYDYIMAGMYKLEIIEPNKINIEIFEGKRSREIQKLFIDKIYAEGKLKPKENIAQVILLFLSMLPLHAENQIRQFALMVNALRLYDKYEEYL